LSKGINIISLPLNYNSELYKKTPNFKRIAKITKMEINVRIKKRIMWKYNVLRFFGDYS
jgi:hypothetical protein